MTREIAGQAKGQAKEQATELIGLGGLSQCMVDGDREALARARRTRRNALAMSIALQAFCVVVLLVWPLIAAPGALPQPAIVTPVPPYHGGEPRTNSPMRPTHIRPHIISDRWHYTPARPSRPARTLDSEPAPVLTADVSADFGLGPQTGPAGAFIPGGSESGGRVPPPRPPAAPREPIRKSEGVMAGALVHKVDPVYPPVARAIHLAGTVRLRAIISDQGRVENLEVLSGSPILAGAAVAAVRQWRYRPTLLNGEPVEVETYITVRFVLGE